MESSKNDIYISEGMLTSEGGLIKSKLTIDRKARMVIENGLTRIANSLLMYGLMNFTAPLSSSVDVSEYIEFGTESELYINLSRSVDILHLNASNIHSHISTQENGQDSVSEVELLKVGTTFKGEFAAVRLDDISNCALGRVIQEDKKESLHFDSFDCVVGCVSDLSYDCEIITSSAFLDIWNEITRDELRDTAVLAGVICAILFLLALFIPEAFRKICCCARLCCCFKSRRYEKLDLDDGP